MPYMSYRTITYLAKTEIEILMWPSGAFAANSGLVSVGSKSCACPPAVSKTMIAKKERLMRVIGIRNPMNASSPNQPMIW